MVVLLSFHRYSVGFFRRKPDQFDYWVDIFHPNQSNFFAPLALIVGDYIPDGCNLSRQWEFAGEEFWLAHHLTQWQYMYFLWEPHP